MIFRKILIVFSIICAITLSACGNNEADRPKLDFDYTCEAEIVVKEDVFKATINKQSGNYSYTFLYPAELEGMVVEVENESYKIIYQGLEQVCDRDSIPNGAVCGFVTSSLEHITHGKGISFTNDGKIVKGTGVFEGGNFSISYNSKSYPDIISIGNEITIDFSNFKKA